MKTRIISGLIGAVLLILVACADAHIFNGAVALVAAVSVYEIYKACGITQNKRLALPGIFLAFAYVFSYSYAQNLLMPITFVFIFCLFAQFMAGEKNLGFEKLAAAFFAAVFPVFLYAHLSALRAMQNGAFIIWFVFIISFLTDTFAYFTGFFLGKHKLAPILSPKKTVEGSVGGFFGAVLGMVVYCVALQKCCNFAPNYLNAVIIAVIGSVVSQFGDLAASSIKRYYGVKDYGNVMPGHGGLMDRFDGIIFTAPIVYYLLGILPII